MAGRELVKGQGLPGQHVKRSGDEGFRWRAVDATHVTDGRQAFWRYALNDAAGAVRAVAVGRGKKLALVPETADDMSAWLEGEVDQASGFRNCGGGGGG